jgi:hypothetical protein
VMGHTYTVSISKIRKLHKRAKQILHEEGFWGLAKKGFFYDERWCICQIRALDYLDTLPETNDLEVKVLTSIAELDELLLEGFDLAGYKLSVNECRERLSAGAVLFCVFISKTFASAVWVCTNKEAGSYFYLFPNDYRRQAIGGGAMTAVQFRGKHISAFIAKKAATYLQDRGFSSRLIQVRIDDVAVQRSVERAGGYIIGKGCHLRLLFLLNISWIVEAHA